MGFANALRKRQLLKGILLTTPSCEIAEAISHTGLQWAFIDLEHGSFDHGSAQNVLRALGGRMASVMRLPDQSPTSIKQALDAGCDGIIVPMIKNGPEARAAVHAAKYPPQGSRSVGLSRAQTYGLRFKEYLKSANTATSVIALIEHFEAVKNLEPILAVEGIDALFIGPYDLSASMNMAGQFDHPKVKGAIDTIFAKARKAGKPVGYFAPDLETAQSVIAKGASLVAVGTDILMVTGAAKKIAALRR